jgi:membrane-bound lytic murein transglycosylase A
MKKTIVLIGILCLLSFLYGCSKLFQRPLEGPEAANILLVPEAQRPVLEDDADFESLRTALSQSLAFLASQPAGKKVLIGTREISYQEILATLELFSEILERHPDPASLIEQVRSRFQLYRVELDDKAVPLLITGYYEPTLRGSRSFSPEYPYPIYRQPDDLLVIEPGRFSKNFQGRKWIGRLVGRQVLPYFSRKEIDRGGSLNNKDLEILWVDDPLKLFFLHIQGSGQVRLDDGAVVKVQYQASNGQAYVPIGRELIRRGILAPEEVSLQSIYAYLKEHPELQGEILDLNPSYVFFRLAENGPYGSLGVPLTPGRSVAMDFKWAPPGGLAWLKGVKPELDETGRIRRWVPMNRWVCIQDSGGAIKGPDRLDLFWGNGDEAEMAAGHLRHPGLIYFLLKK